ncbi:hypothetical protein FRB97_009478 [Tulasnella sp. 331]|nr:hypothetical protein FRB97_009478 [Tulasnella sp. 331]
MPMNPPQNMGPPTIIPAQAHAYLDGGATSFYTAQSRPDEGGPAFFDTQPEEGGSQDPFDHLWGRLVPCNPAFEAFDLLKERPIVTIGRNPNNDLVLTAPKISGRHCQLEYAPDPDGVPSVIITDMSSNGTYITGVKLGRGRYHRLIHGDEICLGMPISSLDNDDFRYIFRLSSSPITTGAGIHSQYQLGDVLGTGSFATVRKAYSKVSKDVFACKIMAKSKLQHNPKQKEYFERELAILQTLRHYNITRLHEYFEDEATIFIVMEFCGGGDLLTWIQKHGPVPEHQARIWSAQMVDAIEYTHRKRIAHRDLKPENILLTGGPNPIVKVADFGLAKQATGGTFLQTMCGTPQYLAPEVVTGGVGSGYDSKVDAYSLGVIIWAMLTNVTCFGVEDETMPWAQRMANRHVEWEILAHRGVSELGENFLRSMIVHDPRSRMSVKEARRHPWLAAIPNVPPADFVGSQQGSQSQSQSQPTSSQEGYSQRSSQYSERAGTEELGDPVSANSTDPYDFADVATKDADGNERWDFGERGGLGGGGGSSGGDMSTRMPGGSSGVLGMDMDDDDPRSGLSSSVASLTMGHEEGLSQDVAGLQLNQAEEMTSVGTPPRRKGGSPSDASGMSWEPIPPQAIPPAPPAAAVIENNNVDARPVKSTPKLRRKAGDARISEPLHTTTPKNHKNAKNVMYDLGASVNSTTTKRKARDLGFDSELSSATPSGDEEDIPQSKKVQTAVDRNAKDKSFSTTSSNSTVRGGNRSKKGSSAERVPESAVVTPASKLRQSTGGAVATAGATVPRASARLRQSSAGHPNTRGQKSTEKRTRVPGRYRAPSGLSDEDDDDERKPAAPAAKAGPSTRTRKSVAASPPPPPTAAAARRTRNGGTAAKAPRLR